MSKKKKEQMVPGKRYRGYGYINEYKEFCFEPEETGAHAGQIKAVCSRDGVKVSESKNFIIVKFNLDKQDEKLAYLKELAKAYNTISQIIQEYDI